MQKKTKIKICGITTIEEINFINELEIDYIGFVFAKSKRKINKEQAKELRNNLNQNIKVVGVFVDEGINVVNEIAEYVGLDIIQLHGEEKQEYIDLMSKPVWKAKKVVDINSLEEVEKLKNITGMLFDGRNPGSGESFNWDLLTNIKFEEKMLILAGGLNSKNVKEAINIVNPDILDLSSGVELNGKKDKDKIVELIRSVKYE